MADILSIFSEVAFPVAVCLCLFWLWREETTSHRSEVAALVDQLHANTLVLQRLVDRLDGVVSDDGR